MVGLLGKVRKRSIYQQSVPEAVSRDKDKGDLEGLFNRLINRKA